MEATAWVHFASGDVLVMMTRQQQCVFSTLRCPVHHPSIHSSSCSISVLHPLIEGIIFFIKLWFHEAGFPQRLICCWSVVQLCGIGTVMCTPENCADKSWSGNIYRGEEFECGEEKRWRITEEKSWSAAAAASRLTVCSLLPTPTILCNSPLFYPRTAPHFICTTQIQT